MKDEETALPATEQRNALNTRTDLDAFNDDEVARLFRHGYSQARYALRNLGITVMPSSDNSSVLLKRAGIQEVNHRKWQIFSIKDPNSWLSVLAVLFWFVVIISPSSFYAFRQKQNLLVQHAEAAKQQQNAANLSQVLAESLKDPNGAHVWPTCVGIWQETKAGHPEGSEASPLAWFSTITTSNHKLHLIRQDGFAQGDFVWQDPKWIGEITFGNGDVWSSIELTPNHNCTLVTTNQSWWYLPSSP